MATGPVLTIHRAADEIGGNCIELEHDGHRLLLDAGSPLVGDGTTEPQGAIPRTLDTSKDIAGLVISHPHQDHWGLLRSLPASWSVWSGAASETLIRMTASLSGGGVAHVRKTRPHLVYDRTQASYDHERPLLGALIFLDHHGFIVCLDDALMAMTEPTSEDVPSGVARTVACFARSRSLVSEHGDHRFRGMAIAHFGHRDR